MLPSPRFSVASAFVPHLCFLSLLCFLSDFPVFPDPLVRAKTFSTHDKPKNNDDVRRKRFNAHARMLPSPRFSVASAFVPHLCFLSFTLLRPLSLLRPHSTRPISSSLFSICSNFSLYLTLLPLFFSNFPISPDPLVRTKTFSTYNKPQNNHDVRGKRFNAHAGMLPSPRFSVASAFVPHLCFLSLLCYVRYLCYVLILLAPFHRPFSLLSLLTPFLCLLGVLFCSVFSDFPHLLCYLCFFEFPCFPCVLCLSAFSLYSVFSQISLFSLTLPCVLKRFPLPTSRKTTTTCTENVLTLTPGHAEHDVLPLTPTPEFPPPGRPLSHP